MTSGGTWYCIERLAVLSTGSLVLHMRRQADDLPRGAVRHGYERHVPVELSGPDPVRQLSHGVNAVERVSIADPSDDSPSARKQARTVHVWRAKCRLRKARSVGCGSLSDQHIAGADMLRIQCDIALIGRGGITDWLSATYTAAAPRAGFSASAVRNAQAAEDIRLLFAKLTPQQAGVLTAVALSNESVARYARAHATSPRRQMDVLLTALDRVVDHWRDAIDAQLASERLIAA